MDRVERVRSAVSEVRAFAMAAKQAGPPCRDCAFHSLGSGVCSNLAFARQAFDPATGKYGERFETTFADARSAGGLCGPEALLFEPPPKHIQFSRDTARSIATAARWTAIGLAVSFMLYSWF